MVSTRASHKADTATAPLLANKAKTSKKRAEPAEVKEETDAKQAPIKKAKKTGDKASKDVDSEHKCNHSTVEKLLDTYGALPLQETSLAEPSKPIAETLLAHLLNAMLTSTRISHQLAAKTVATVIEAGYADLSKLEESSWEERTKVLTDGGYTHYREKTATQMGDLAELLRADYDGDLNNLLKAVKDDVGDDSVKVREGMRQRLKDVKGLGNVALDIFCDTAQGVWPELAPFIDPRSQKTAEALGVPAEARELFDAVGKDPVRMCKLASALTTVRLDKKEKEFA